MNAAEVAELGRCLAGLLRRGEVNTAIDELGPTISQKTPFAQLDRIGAAIGSGPLRPVNRLLERVAATRSVGGWVVIGGALQQQLGRDRAGVLSRCRNYIATGDGWYVSDILGERVPGQGLVDDFGPTLRRIAPWRDDTDARVRRALGVAVHYWAKRSQGAAELRTEAARLLALVEPLFESRDIDAVKGVGRGLKTLGRYFPELVTDWLKKQIDVRGRRPHQLMRRKALKFLSREQRARIESVSA